MECSLGLHPEVLDQPLANPQQPLLILTWPYFKVQDAQDARVLPKGVPQGQTESGGIVLAAICWAPSARRRCYPREALYLPTFTVIY
jgi:hypothetical protein